MGPGSGGSALRFGTDGVRGVANVELTAELTLALGRAVARVLAPGEIVVGRDTRLSGSLLGAALAAGLASEGVDVTDLGVLPTPGVAFVACARGVPGAVISASHNPYADNGVKIFGRGGLKLSTDTEAAIEVEWRTIVMGRAPTAPASARSLGAIGEGVGAIGADPLAVDAYAAQLVGCLSGRRLDRLSVVVDCAHGAASAVAPRALASLGAEVTTISADPDGTNINDACGSTHPASLQAAVLANRADLGLAFDGDADRCLAVDDTGRLVDGDHLMALFALDLAGRGELDGGAVAVTVMSNLGFRQAMEAAGIEVVETPVGDRHVLDAMEARGLALGGEQSGHIVFRRLATTGDGILTGALLADLVCRGGAPLSELASSAMTRLPQHLANVALPPGRLDLLASSASLRAAIAEAEVELGSSGRLLLRRSGTEPLVRVMAEAPTPDGAIAVVEKLCAVLRSELA
ncbi:MAG: phosphoglucosamine mutase [Acidimicrobiales bacterium]